MAGGLGVAVDLEGVQTAEHVPMGDLTALLFAESPTRFLIELRPDAYRAVVELADRDEFDGITLNDIGDVVEEPRLTVKAGATQTLVEARLEDLKSAWQTPLGR